MDEEQLSRKEAFEIAMSLPSEAKWLETIPARVDFTEVGYLSGHVSLIDKKIAEENGFKPLNDFERWLLEPVINELRVLRRQVFGQTMAEELGEDPADWIM